MNESDPRVRRSRKLLHDAFRSLVAEKGFHATSVQDVTERADVNRGTFYAHFPDKYALLEDVVGEMFRTALRQRVPKGAPFTLENLERLTVAVLEFVVEFLGSCRPSDRETAPLVETSMQRQLGEFFSSWLAEIPPAAPASVVTPETAASVLSWALFGAGIEWSRSPRVDPVEKRAREIVVLLAGALSQLGDLCGEAPLPSSRLAARRS